MRDMELVREILLQLEKAEYDGLPKQVSVEAYTENQVNYHVKLLYEAGLIEANEITAANYGPEWEPIALTWDGHEFLEAARDRSRWSKALEVVKEKSGGLVFEVLKTVLIQSAKAAALS